MPSQISIVMTGDEKRAWQAMQAMIQQQAKFIAGTEEGTRKSKEFGDSVSDVGKTAVADLARMGAGFLTVEFAIGKISQAYREWRDEIHNVSEASNQAMKDLISLAAMQEGGTKKQRITQAAELAANYGVNEPGTAYNIVQSMQSAAKAADPNLSDEDAWRRGLSGAAEAFKMNQLGVSLKSAADAAIQATVQKQDVGSFLRKAYLAGEAGTRTPEDAVAAAKALQFFDDKTFGFAASAIISGEQAKTGGEGETEVYLRRAGQGLSDTGDLAKNGFWQKHGLAPNATQEQRLQKLVELGLDTPSELETAGIMEDRQVKGVQTLVQNWKELQSAKAAIMRDDRPGMFEARRAGVEEELPAAKLQREMDSLRVMRLNAQAFPATTDQLEEEKLGMARAVALRRYGMRFGPFGGNLEDEKGLVGPWDWFVARQMGSGLGDYNRRQRELGLPEARGYEQIGLPTGLRNEALDREVAELMKNAAADLKQAAQAFKDGARGGPLLLPAGGEK